MKLITSISLLILNCKKIWSTETTLNQLYWQALLLLLFAVEENKLKISHYSHIKEKKEMKMQYFFAQVSLQIWRCNWKLEQNPILGFADFDIVWKAGPERKNPTRPAHLSKGYKTQSYKFLLSKAETGHYFLSAINPSF